MSANERRQELIELLCHRRHDTYENLAQAFGVSKRTIRYDVERLTLSYPIETASGRYGGGVKIADWYRQDRTQLTPEQASLLTRLASTLNGEEQTVMNEILAQFAPSERLNR